MTFSSMSLTEEGVLSDLYAHAVRGLQANDLIPPDAGTNSPLYTQPIRTTSDFLTGIAGQFDAQRARQGGRALDTPMTPPDQTYAARRRSFLQAEEGVRTWAYDDRTGRPVPPGAAPQGKVTVGVGFNMDKGPAARQEWAAAFGPDGPSFDDVRAGRKALTTEQVYKLFDYTLNAVFEPILENKFRGVKLTTPQRLALLSAAYNGPRLLDPLVEPARRGDWKTVAALLERGNGDTMLSARRRREAAMILGADV
jgi:GH24 family phage-related lysozyme (muramidase)